MKSVRDPSQSIQRVRVGLIGLAAVIFLIGLASFVIGSATRERPVMAIGAPQADVVANMGLDNGAGPSTEPLAELGVAPSTNVQTPASTR